jgi:YaiO family outer membrane protein
MHLKKQLASFLPIVCLICSTSLFAQDDISSDELFAQARTAAFDKKDYQLAIELSRKALVKSPDYSDIRIFLGRVYTWSDKKDSARIEFERVLSRDKENEDASIAYTDLEYWNDDPAKALRICESGLVYHPGSNELLLRKAKCLIELKRFGDANNVVNLLLKADTKNDAAHALAEKIKDLASKNKIGISYDFTGFDKQFANPWHLVSISYSRSTSFGSVIGRFNYANRFTTSAVQFEADAYPRISKTFYSYISGGISNKSGVFPQYRAGFSLYANLPKSFEAEAGFRYLYFSDATWIYTASLGKYFKSYWFNFRTYLTPGNNNISRSFSLTTRYYFGGAYDYLSIGLSTGISPDDQVNNIQLGSKTKLKSNGISAGFYKNIRKVNIISITAGWSNQEYLASTFGNQYNFGLAYQKRF